jgi:manganese oxidase
MVSRRQILSGAALIAGSAASAAALKSSEAVAAELPAPGGPGRVIVPNGAVLPYEMDKGVKVFRLTAEPIKHEMTKGLVINAWGYNGRSPGPVIEAVEGDRVRILVTNKLPERTAVHWHGVLLPNGMDGVGGLTQPHIPPGETWAYEFTLRQHGTLMYHPHSDETVQIAMGMMGFFIIHPKKPVGPKIDRDFCIFLHEWKIRPGTATPDPMAMNDFNFFTFNSISFPSTQHLIVKKGERVRVRLANISMDSHPIHIHGHKFVVTGTDGGDIPASAQHPETTVNVPPGTTRTFDFVADAPGDWPLHCHKSHHTMNGMEHDLPNTIGVKQRGVEERIQKLLPDYMAMGETGMGGMQEMTMAVPKNTVPMMAGDGPFGAIEMGGMFTVIKIREGITSYEDPGWYRHPEGTLPYKVS